MEEVTAGADVQMETADAGIIEFECDNADNAYASSASLQEWSE